MRGYYKCAQPGCTRLTTSRGMAGWQQREGAWYCPDHRVNMCEACGRTGIGSDPDVWFNQGLCLRCWMRIDA